MHRVCKWWRTLVQSRSAIADVSVEYRLPQAMNPYVGCKLALRQSPRMKEGGRPGHEEGRIQKGNWNCLNLKRAQATIAPRFVRTARRPGTELWSLVLCFLSLAIASLHSDLVLCAPGGDNARWATVNLLIFRIWSYSTPPCDHLPPLKMTTTSSKLLSCYTLPVLVPCREIRC